MNKETRDLIEILSENGQDFEWYPTTEEMLKEVYTHIRWENHTEILDVGCGLCGLKKIIDKKNDEIEKYNESLEKSCDRKYIHPYTYYGIEKSEILINRLPSDVYIVGTDFNNCTLIDKKCDVLFCNPPYSEYVEWTKRIINEGNFQQAFLIIPQRWKENKEIQALLEGTKTKAYIIRTMDFLNAERQARAVIDIVEFTRDKYSIYGDNIKTPFDRWFEETFDVSTDGKKLHDFEEYEENKKRISSNIVEAPNKITALCELYQEDMNRLCGSFKAICGLDEKTLEDIGVNYKAVKEALKKKIEGLKILYWRMVFNYLDEVTNRLTASSRKKLFDDFERLNTVDFNESNIRSVLIWVLKNATNYYKEQLIDFYRQLSDFENVRPYKSNQKVFDRDDWRWNGREKSTKYTLDYRLVCSYLFKTKVGWNGEFDSWNNRENVEILKDFCAIAQNLGFNPKTDFMVPEDFGTKGYVFFKDGSLFMEYKFYKNHNTHIKLNIEFTKAMNVEVSRLLGWIRDKKDIEKEFPEEMAKGAEKYFGMQFCFSLVNPNIKLLEGK